MRLAVPRCAATCPTFPSHAPGEGDAFIAALIGESSKTRRVLAPASSVLLSTCKSLYFRRLFLTSAAQRQLLFDTVGGTYSATPQLKIRDRASAATLAGMIRCFLRLPSAIP